MQFLLLCMLVLLAPLGCPVGGRSALADETGTSPPREIVVRSALAVSVGGSRGRSALHRDPIEAERVAGTWKAPAAGDTVTLSDGSKRAWQEIKADEKGSFSSPSLRGGYAYSLVDSPIKRVMILEAAGHRMVYAAGAPRAGDPYSHGYVHIPVLLEKGSNPFLFLCPRGRLRAQLVAPAADVFLDTADTTLPDCIVGQNEPLWGAVVVANATARKQGGLRLEAACAGGAPLVTEVPPLMAMSVRKVPFRIAAPARAEAGTLQFELRLVRNGEHAEPLHGTGLSLRVRKANETQKRTFVSRIDGSVQYYALNPARAAASESGLPRARALFLTLHGAAVEAIGQADAYEAKSWGHLVAPTNRRPYGFDWEDWGRLDALEVLALAQQELGTDPARTYLTGHSMGGHGVWHLGATFPDRFAAIGPSAGWVSMWSYAGARREANASPLAELLDRAARPSDTLALVRNYAQHGVYVLHGEADDNVPVSEARAMKEQLARFHRDFLYHEQPRAGHWWDDGDEPGAGCVDWAPMFDFFAHHVIPADESLREVDFTTASPGVSARCHWVAIEAQREQARPSSVHLRCDPGQRRFVGKTENVARLRLELPMLAPGAPVRVELDGQKLADIPWPSGKSRIWLVRADDEWVPCPAPSAALKGPHRYGPFKEAFRNRVIFVYGTRGTSEENTWSRNRARYDAEMFWYQGNASVDVRSDSDFLANPEPDRNVILYGHRGLNAAWDAALGECPVRVERGAIRIGVREAAGDALACLFIRPRKGSDVAAVGVVAGTGMPGLRLTERLPYFTSGVAYPDCLVLDPNALRSGIDGVVCAGFFGNDWTIDSGEFRWRE